MSYGDHHRGGAPRTNGRGIKGRLWTLLAAGTLALAGCGGGGGSTSSTVSPNNPPPEEQPQTVALSGTVVGSTQATAFSVTVSDGQGHQLAQWSTDADGRYQGTVPGTGPFHVTAAPVDATPRSGSAAVCADPAQCASPRRASAPSGATADAPLRAICTASPCDLTPWSSLLVALSEQNQTSLAAAEAELRSLAYFDLPGEQDPFMLHRSGELASNQFDAAAVLALLQSERGLADWLQAMTGWMTDTEHNSAPAAVPVLRATLNQGTGGAGAVTEIAVARSKQAVFTIAPAPGYHLVGISGCDGQLAGNIFTTAALTDHCSISAQFAPNRYTLNYGAGNNGSLTGQTSQTIVHGGNAAMVTAVADTGYRFLRWSDNRTDNPRTDLGLQADLSVQAQFELLQYPLSYGAGNGGSVTGTASQTVPHGGAGTAVTAVASTGYRFVRWSDGSTANPRTDLGVGAVAVQAEFERIQYQVTYSAGSNGSLTGQTSQTIAHGDDGTAVAAVAAAGYEFERWSDGSTANPRTDLNLTADLSVSASFVTTAVVLNVAEAHRAALTGSGSQLRVRNEAVGNALYLLVPANLSATALPLTVAAIGNTTPTGGASPGTTTSPQDGHAATRRGQAATFIARTGTTGSGTPVTPASSIPAGTPTVGDAWSLNTTLADHCDAGTAGAATVRAVGSYVIVVSDDSNPVGGFIAADYQEIADAFDHHIYPGATRLLGTPPDRDGNGRVVLFITAAVNRLAPPASSADLYPYALYSLRDRLSQAECPTSNAGEIIYTLAPDPTGSIDGYVRQVSTVKGSTLAPIAHELAHLIVDGRRAAGGHPLEEGWMDEALAGAAVESAFYERAIGIAPLQNIALSNLTTGPNASNNVAAFNAYANSLYGLHRSWLRNASAVGVLDGDSATQAQRGVAWAFLRYAADRYAGGSLLQEASFFYALAGGPATGVDNLGALINDDPLVWLQDFQVSVFTDDHGIAGLPSRYTSATWNYRSLYGGLGGFPLWHLDIAAEGSLNVSLTRGGSTAYLRLAIGAGATATLNFTHDAITGGEAPFTLIRLQ